MKQGYVYLEEAKMTKTGWKWIPLENRNSKYLISSQYMWVTYEMHKKYTVALKLLQMPE